MSTETEEVNKNEAEIEQANKDEEYAEALENVRNMATAAFALFIFSIIPVFMLLSAGPGSIDTSNPWAVVSSLLTVFLAPGFAAATMRYFLRHRELLAQRD